MVVEAVLAIGAGIAARSMLLTGFGFDSVIELLSGVTLLWRLSSEARGLSAPRLGSVERRAATISGVLPRPLFVYPLFFRPGRPRVWLPPHRSLPGGAGSPARSGGVSARSSRH